MTDRSSFFAYARANLFAGTLAQAQVDGLTAILDAAEQNPDIRWTAYMLATAHHETNKTMQPVREAYWLADPDAYLKTHHADYYPFYGRGYVQLTWLKNYQKASAALGQDFVGHPDLVMQPENAAQIMLHGMTEGWFTGRKLADYFNTNSCDWENARRIINGTDRAVLVADYGRKYQAALVAQ